MKRQLQYITAFSTLAFAVIGASGCSHAPLDSSSSNSSPTVWTHTSVDIHYMLGHSHRQLLIEADAAEIHARCLHDGNQLKQAKLDPPRYQDYLSKVRDFVDKRRSVASDTLTPPQADCRDPYTITLKNTKDIAQVPTEIHGCRMKDEGAFSHLVQDGEFLIYRQK